MKKMPGDIIILQWCSKNHDHILYCSLDMVRDTCNYFSFWVIFCTFTLLTAQKIKIKKKKKKWKTLLEISSFHTSVSKIMIIWHTVPEIWCMTDVIVIFHYVLFFVLLKMPGDIIILYMCTTNHDQMMYGSWDMVCSRWMDGWKKWHIEVSGPPKKQKGFLIFKHFFRHSFNFFLC